MRWVQADGLDNLMVLLSLICTVSITLILCQTEASFHLDVLQTVKKRGMYFYFLDLGSELIHREMNLHIQGINKSLAQLRVDSRSPDSQFPALTTRTHSSQNPAVTTVSPVLLGIVSPMLSS